MTTGKVVPDHYDSAASFCSTKGPVIVQYAPTILYLIMAAGLWMVFKKAGVDDLITLVLGDAHEAVKRYDEPIDILFLDADKEGYIDYLEKLLPLIRPGGLVIAHNMNTRQPDLRYVKAITENPELETLILLKEGTGVSVTLKKH